MAAQNVELLKRHNERIGTVLQLVAQRFFLICIFGTFVYPLLHFLFKLEVRGRVVLNDVGNRFIYAAQHYYEWDPLLLWCAGLWVLALRRNYFIANSIAGPFWSQTSLHRAASWLLGIMFTIKGHELESGAVGRAARLLNGPLPLTIAVYPTGPVGRSRDSRFYPGIQLLAESCPAVPIVPVTLRGLQEITLRDVLMLKRPPLFVEFGTPFFGMELLDTHPEERLSALHEKLMSAWGKPVPCATWQDEVQASLPDRPVSQSAGTSQACKAF